MVQWYFCWQADVRESLGPSSGSVTAVGNRILEHLQGESPHPVVEAAAITRS